MYRTIDCYSSECVNSELEPKQNYIAMECVQIYRPFGGVSLVGTYIASPNTPGALLRVTLSPDLTIDISEYYLKRLTV